MPFHTLLDWRLARDLFRVVQGGVLEIDADSENRVLKQWGIATNSEVLDIANSSAARFMHRGAEFVVCIKHPLEASDVHLMAPRLENFRLKVKNKYSNARGVIFIDAFSLDRDPRRVHEMAGEILDT